MTEMYTFARLQQRISLLAPCSLHYLRAAPKTLVAESLWSVCAPIFKCQFSVYLMPCIYACTYVGMNVYVHVCICVHMHMCVLACEGPKLVPGFILRCYQPQVLRQDVSISRNLPGKLVTPRIQLSLPSSCWNYNTSWPFYVGFVDGTLAFMVVQQAH